MKLKTLNFCVYILLLALGGDGCKKTEVIDNTQFVIKKCPCDHETKFIKSVIIDKILLFDASKTSHQQMKDLSFDGNQSFFISYSPDAETLTEYIFINNNHWGVSYVCNFPLLIKNWVIPSDGINISYTAHEYQLCNSTDIVMENGYSNLVLLSIKNLNN